MLLNEFDKKAYERWIRKESKAEGKAEGIIELLEDIGEVKYALRRKRMNFIDKALEQKLTGDDFLQALAGIFSEWEVREILNRYPLFISDVISIIEYDTALQMDGFDDIINGNLSDRCTEIIDALERCGAVEEADNLRNAKYLSDMDEAKYEAEYDTFDSKLVLNNDYEGFWDLVRTYIDKNLERND